MAKQRNEPNDPAAELADYDFSLSEGTSPDDINNIETKQWPADVPKEEFRDSGKDIVPEWVQSFYTTPSQSNITEFAKQIDDYSKPVVRYNVLKAAQEKIRKNHLRPSERLAIAALSYHDDLDTKELAEKYSMSKVVFDYANYAFNRIIDAQDVSKEQLENEFEKYKKANPSHHAYNEPVEDKTGYENVKDELTEYLLDHPEQSAEKVIQETGFDVKPQQVNGLRANLYKHGHIDNSEENKEKEQQTIDESNTDAIKLELELDKQDARQIVLNQELSEELKGRIVTTILDDVGL